MMQFIRRTLLAFITILCSLLIILIASQPGLVFLSKTLPLFMPGKFTIQKAEGQLFNDLHLGHLQYDYQETHIHIDDIRIKWHILTWQPITLAFPNIAITGFVIKNTDNTVSYAIQHLQLAGSLRAHDLESQFVLLWHDMDIPASEQFSIMLPSGLLNISGPLPHYEAQGQFYSTGNQFPRTVWTLLGSGDFEQVHISSLTGTPLDGTTILSGDVTWLPDVTWNITLQGEALNPEKTWPTAAGKFNLNVKSTGIVTALHSNYTLKIDKLAGIFHNKALHGKGNIAISDDAYHFENFSLQMGNAALQVNGDINEKTANIASLLTIPDAKDLLNDAKGEIHSRINILGDLNNPRMQANLSFKDIIWETFKIGTLEMDADAYGNIEDAGNIAIKGTDLFFNTQHIKKLDLQASNQHKKNQLQLDAENIQATLHLKLNGMFSSDNWQGSIQQFLLHLNEAGNISLAKPAKLALSKNSIIFQPFCLSAAFGNTCIQKANLQKIPSINTSEVSNIKGALQLSTHDLAFLSVFYPQLHNVTGNVAVNFAIAGTTENPTIEGDAILQKGNVDIPRIGLKIRDIAMRMHGNQHELSYNAQAGFDKGMLKITGATDLSQPKFATQIKIVGNNLTIMNTHEAMVIISPDLIGKWEAPLFSLTGKIFIPFAKITPRDLSSTVTLPRDVVFVTNQQTETQPNTHLYSHIQILLGDKITVDYSGLTGEIKGSVTVEDKPGGSTLATGVLNINNGHYQAYGQNLTIRPSRLIYTGGSVNNPGINIQAVKKMQILAINSGSSTAAYSANEQIVGVSINGTLNKPTSRLFAEPAGLSQTDILSYLILGRPASQATKQDSSSILQALSLLNLGNGTTSQIKNQFSNLLGLDQFTLSNEEEYNSETNSIVENTSLLLGKALSPRLYVSYSLGLIQPINTIKMIYKMKHGFSLQSTHSTNANGVDVFYTLERK